MTDLTNTAADSSDRYFLHDRDRWESLGFDWESWNSTVEKILLQQAESAPKGQEKQGAGRQIQ